MSRYLGRRWYQLARGWLREMRQYPRSPKPGDPGHPRFVAVSFLKTRATRPTRMREQTNRPTLVKVIDEHDVAGRVAFLRIEDPTAIGRDRKVGTELTVDIEDCASSRSGELKVSD